MSKLITDLKEQHSIITENLNKVKELGISTEEGQKKLISVKTVLLDHLKKEDMELYPSMNKLAETDTGLKRTLDFYAKDMDEISQTALGFFEKYSTGGSGLEFAKDFGRLFGTLSQRIRKEEITLYERYDQLSLG